MQTHGVFLVHGLSGCGKSHLLDLLVKTFPDATVHRKDSTRDPRAIDADINCVDAAYLQSHREEYVAVYERYGRLYGIRRDQWDEAYRRRQLHFVIVTDVNTIRHLKMQYMAKAIHIHADPRDLQRVLRQRRASLTQEELERLEGVSIKERIRRMNLLVTEYVENCTLFDYCVLNFIYPQEHQSAAMRQLQQIVNHHLHTAAQFLKQ